MTHIEKNINSFYIKPFFWSWGISLIVYSFMLFQFWWGNHDWDSLKQGVNFSSGLFEARFSQFILPILLFDGHILPIISYIISIGLLSATGIISAKYLNLSQKQSLIVTLFVSLNPHNFILFYYVYLVLPFCAWTALSVAVLFCTTRPLTAPKYLLGTFGLFLILGGYPPIISFCCTLFMAKQVIEYTENKINFRNFIQQALFFMMQMLLAGLCFKGVEFLLKEQGYIRDGWYNLQTKSHIELMLTFLWSWGKALQGLFSSFAFLGTSYYLPLAGLVFLSFWVIMNKRNKIIVLILVLGMLMASEIVNTMALNADHDGVQVRLCYWNRLGLYLFALSVLLQQNHRYLKNLIFAGLILLMFIFANIDFYIMKVWSLGFIGGRNGYARILNAIEQQPDFNAQREYITMIFGQPNFRQKYAEETTQRITQKSDLLELEFSFGVNMGSVLFLDTWYNPIALGMGVMDDRSIFRMVQNKKQYAINEAFLQTTPEKVEKMRYWLYKEAKVGTGYNSVYVDDKYILVIPDIKAFYSNREIVINYIQQRSK